jgi:hypothetical protein
MFSGASPQVKIRVFSISRHVQASGFEGGTGGYRPPADPEIKASMKSQSMAVNVRMSHRLRLLSSVVLLSLLAGCGGGEFSTASVTGKVVMNGQPVTEGVITFAPLGDGKSDEVGKPASGDVGPDGTFTLSTYEDNDGAVVGRHRVMYALPLTPPEAVPAGAHGGPVQQQSPYAGAKVLTPEVEVKSGDNNFEIEIAI